MWLVQGAGVMPYLVERTGGLIGMEGGCIRFGGTRTLRKKKLINGQFSTVGKISE